MTGLPVTRALFVWNRRTDRQIDRPSAYLYSHIHKYIQTLTLRIHCIVRSNARNKLISLELFKYHFGRQWIFKLFNKFSSQMQFTMIFVHIRNYTIIIIDNYSQKLWTLSTIYWEFQESLTFACTFLIVVEHILFEHIREWKWERKWKWIEIEKTLWLTQIPKLMWLSHMNSECVSVFRSIDRFHEKYLNHKSCMKCSLR